MYSEAGEKEPTARKNKQQHQPMDQNEPQTEISRRLSFGSPKLPIKDKVTKMGPSERGVRLPQRSRGERGRAGGSEGGRGRGRGHGQAGAPRRAAGAAAPTTLEAVLLGLGRQRTPHAGLPEQSERPCGDTLSTGIASNACRARDGSPGRGKEGGRAGMTREAPARIRARESRSRQVAATGGGSRGLQEGTEAPGTQSDSPSSPGKVASDSGPQKVDLR